jgi:predicted ATPase
MSSEDTTKMKIPALQEAQTYNRWCFLIKLTLQNQKLWDETKDLPNDSTTALILIISSLHPDLQEQLLNTIITDPTAQLAWKYLKSLCITSYLSSKSTAFHNIISFTFTGQTMAQNKAIIKSYGRELSTSFKNATSIKIEDLLLLIALANLPLQYHHLRATLEEMDKPSPSTTVSSGKETKETAVTSSKVAHLTHYLTLLCVKKRVSKSNN